MIQREKMMVNYENESPSTSHGPGWIATYPTCSDIWELLPRPNPPSPIPIISNVTSWREVGLWFRLEAAPSHPLYDKHSVTNKKWVQITHFLVWCIFLHYSFSLSTHASFFPVDSTVKQASTVACHHYDPVVSKKRSCCRPSMWEFNGNPMIH